MISSLELARICGVSQGTVDRALHDRPGIRPKTKARILKIAARHGYRPHPATLELLHGRSSTVVAVGPDSNSLFFMDLFASIRAALRQAGFRFVICPVSDADEMLDALRDAAARRSRAAVVVPPADNIAIPATLRNNLNILSLLSPCKGRGLRFITPDEERTGRDAVAYLAAKGHRRILHLTYERQAYAITARRRGYTASMKTHGLKSTALAQPGNEKLVAAVRQHGITAIFCHNDWLALAALRALTEARLRVPEDVSVLGVDNSPTFVRHCPDMTTLEYPMGWLAQQVLHAVQDKPLARRAPRFRLIERATVGPPPA